MDFLSAILLGLVQGLTEFLPVSSSGHLVIIQSMMSNFSQPGILYDTLLHFATLCAILLFFRRRVGLLFQAFFGIFLRRYNVVYYENKRFLWGIIIASIPTGAIGLYLEQWSETLFSSTTLVGYSLIMTSILLILSDRMTGEQQVSGISAFFIGVVQGLAVIPGISRSGSTIAAGLFFGLKREEIAEFSFLMSVPAVLGATLLQINKASAVPAGELSVYLAGMFASFASGLLAIGVMMALVRNASLKFFALYCLIVGIISVVWL